MFKFRSSHSLRKYFNYENFPIYGKDTNDRTTLHADGNHVIDVSCNQFNLKFRQSPFRPYGLHHIECGCMQLSVICIDYHRGRVIGVCLL